MKILCGHLVSATPLRAYDQPSSAHAGTWTVLKGVEGIEDENGTTLRPWLRSKSGPLILSVQSEPADADVSYVHVRSRECSAHISLLPTPDPSDMRGGLNPTEPLRLSEFFAVSSRRACSRSGTETSG